MSLPMAAAMLGAILIGVANPGAAQGAIAAVGAAQQQYAITFTRANDWSYGVYIYAFPTQQLLVLFGVERLGLVAYIVVATAVTYPLAALSWFLVEKRALRHKTVPWRRRAVVRAVPPPARAEDPAR